MSPEPCAATSTQTVMPAPPAAGEGRFYLLVLESGSSSMFHLPRNGLVLIGRIAEAELQLQDASVSRRHARLTIADGTVSIADLESHNGTRVNGERVTALRPVASGDVIHVGDVAMVLHRTVRAAAAAGRTLLPEAMIHERAGEELQRALHFQRVCALLLVQLPPGGRDRAAVQGVIVPMLRPMDAAGWLGDSQLLLVLPELPEAKARALGAELLNELAQALGSAPAVGVASCPFDGCDLETLLVAGRAAVSAGGPAKVRAASEAATDLQMGDRSIILADPAMLRVFDLLQRLAKSDLPVLIHGETGAGKENAAYAVHHYSARSAKGPFIAINCAAIPETLIEAELFGYERGAFSGATQSKAGLFESASGGTVFLDEIGELSLPAQAKMLRVLETQRVTRVGEVREREVNVRVVAATHRDLQEEIKARRFREDLYFRLGAATVFLPPLRERPREVALLALRFLASACARCARPPMTLTPAVLQALAAYKWPGNVRELKNLMEYLAAAELAQDV
ncbi:MAG TPA: sigma 54-interacting transcriptional regulator, partial [Pseudomonadota bacterium]|nr:sigma 54-interacting transcriptional regulator [Pseudomonadota bacterium]